MKRWLTVAVLAAALAIGFLLLNRSDAPSPGAPAPIVLNRSIGPEPGSVDPQVARTTQAQHVMRDLYEGLTGYSASGELVAGAAERWEISEDGLEYRFWLRPDARWSNGEPVTAEDFVFSFRRLVNPQTAAFYAEHLSPLVNAAAIVAGELPPDQLGATAVSAEQLTLRLERPTAHFLLLLAQPPAFPVNARALAEHGERFTRPGTLVSNGAYTLEGWTLGSVMQLRRNEQYWNNAGTAIDVVRYHVAPEPGNELNRYLAGEIDITTTVPSEAFQRLKRERGDELRTAPTLSVYYYGFNLTKPLLGENPKLREALSLAIDRRSLVDKVVARGETPAYSFVVPGTRNYDPPELYIADLAAEEREQRAKRLYAEAGFGPDNPLQIEVRYNSSETHQRVALAVQQMWRDVLGFEATLVNEEFKVLVANVTAMQVTEIFRLSWTADYDDAYSFLGIFGSDSSSNLFAWQNDEFDDLLQRAAVQTDLDRRRLFLEEAERIMLAEHPMIPLYFYVSKHLIRDRIRGWQDNLLDYHYSQHLSIDADR